MREMTISVSIGIGEVSSFGNDDACRSHMPTASLGGEPIASLAEGFPLTG